MENIKIIKVEKKKDQKEFVKFPLRLYKGNPYFVPPLFSDEMKIFGNKHTYVSTCDTVCFLAKKGKETVGRIQGILQKQYNEIHGTKQVRFSRFDTINDEEVAKLLLSAVENWGREVGADTIVGPLGFSDLEREGLLIEGFDHLATFEEQYNYDYYQSLIENNGYTKDVDWVEYRIFPEVYKNEKLYQIGNDALEKLGLHFGGEGLKKRAYIKKYKDGIFACLDECYKELYGTVPFTPEMIKEMVAQFILVLNRKYIFVLCDKDENVVSFGFAIPAIGKDVQKSGGRLTLPTIFKVLRTVRHPKGLDMALVGIMPRYRNTGLNAIIIAEIQSMMKRDKIEYMETNLNLEDNISVQGQWKYFKNIQHKRRRSYKKEI